MTATVAVLGPGAVGGSLAVPLALAGHDVTCVAPAPAAAAIAREGLTLERGGEVLSARPRAAERLSRPVDLLLVTVKAPALGAALGRVGAPAGVAVPLLNGLEHVDALRAALDSEVVAGTIGRLEAYREGPTRVVQTTPRALVTLAADGAAASLLQEAEVDVRVEPDERRVLWEKAARLAVLAAATSIAQRPVGELCGDATWRARLQSALAEACAVAAADGAPLDAEAQWAIVESLPPGLTTSTARDVAAGRESELDAITGAVVRAARRLGVAAPELDRLWEEACRASSR